MKLGPLSPIMKTWSTAYTDDPLHCYECHKLDIFKVSGSLIAPNETHQGYLLWLAVIYQWALSNVRLKQEPLHNVSLVFAGLKFRHLDSELREEYFVLSFTQGRMNSWPPQLTSPSLTLVTVSSRLDSLAGIVANRRMDDLSDWTASEPRHPKRVC